MMAPSEKPAGRIPELDGVRAFAIIAVILSHLCTFHVNFSGEFPDFALQLGPKGVEYFFVLSGFVITRGLLDERERIGRISLGNFWIRRCYRILPAYWAYLLGVAVLGWALLISTDANSLMWSVLLMTNIVNVDWFHMHTWSLSVEEQFYIIGPILAFVVLRRRPAWIGPALGMIYLGCLFWRRDQHYLSLLHIPASLYFLSSFRYICAGVVLGFFNRGIARSLRPIHGAIVAAAALGTILLNVSLLNLGDCPVDHFVLLAYECVYPLLIAGIIGWVAFEASRCRWLRWPILQWTGRRSYSLYLWQQLFLAPPLLVAAALRNVSWVLSTALLFACGACSYAFVERPLIALGRGRGSEQREKGR